MRHVFVAIVLALSLSPAAAADPDFTLGFADVLAAESFCGLHYEQPAVEAAVAANVAASDIGFTSQLRGLIFLAERAQEQMTPSVAAAHCAQIRRLATGYGLVSGGV